MYKHYCSHDGAYYGVFVDVEHECQPNSHDKDESDHSCCAIEIEGQNQFETDCCTSDVKVYQLDTDLATHDNSIDFKNHFSTTFNVLPLFAIIQVEDSKFLNKSPPALPTLKRLSFFQRYLI
uniref:hypothetical protein n=1 Tax=Brumimicrobium salinarum TaxID=2058658 RepID=UPI0010564BA7|nr:hypothetical protein [Brumimicrobium salinarum]